MVVTKLANGGGGPGFTGYFHPSAVDLLPFGYGCSGGGVVQGAPSSVLPTVPSPSVGMFQPVTPMDCDRFEVRREWAGEGGTHLLLALGYFSIDHARIPLETQHRSFSL